MSFHPQSINTGCNYTYENFTIIPNKLRQSRNKRYCIQTYTEFSMSNLYKTLRCLPDSTPFTRQDLTQIIAQLPKPFVIIGDFNSRNIVWGSSYTDNPCKVDELLLESSDLILLNNGKPTRHNPINGNLSAIDLSIATPKIAPGIE